MRKFCSIVGILEGVVDCVRDKFSIHDTIAPKLICDDGIDKLMSEQDKPPNVDSFMRPLRNSKTQRRVV